MAHVFTQLTTHIIFSTHRRRPIINARVRRPLHEYLAGIMRNVGATAIKIGGVADHIHVLVSTPPEMSVAEATRLMKCNSSKWMRDSFDRIFSWQRGYAAFSVSRSNVGAVAAYIARQEEHHRKRTFFEEWSAFMRAYGVSPAHAGSMPSPDDAEPPG